MEIFLAVLILLVPVAAYFGSGYVLHRLFPRSPA